MSTLFIIVPPWVCGTLVTLVGYWGEKQMASSDGPDWIPSAWGQLIPAVFGNLIFLAIIPTLTLAVFLPMLPFTGARAGLALALAVFLFGLTPARLNDLSQRGWNRTLWILLIDFLRVTGSLTLTGWLLTR